MSDKETQGDDPIALHESDAHRSALSNAELVAREEELLRQVEVLAAEVAQSHQRFLDLVEASGDGILVARPSGRIEYANPSAARLFGKDAGWLNGQELGLPMVPYDVTEIDVLRADETPGVAEMRVEPVIWKGQSSLRVTLTDVTERVRVREMETRLLHADRLAAVGQLAAGVAHEINNPSTYVSGNLFLASSHLDDLRGVFNELTLLDHLRQQPAEVSDVDRLLEERRVAATLDEMQEMLDEAADGMRRITRIVGALSTFSRVDQGPLQPVALNSVIERAAKMLDNEIRHRAVLVKKLGVVPDIMAEQGQLGQVCTNLLLNAVQSIQEGATTHNTITVETCSTGGEVSLVIEDTGGGIEKHLLKRVFDPFYTTKGPGQGTGLGLSLSTDIVRRYDGRILLTSEVGQGTRVDVRFPVPATPPRPPSKRHLPPSAGLDTRRARILIIDDEPTVLRVFQRMLGTQHEVVIAEGGDKALAVLEQDTHFDVVICDLMMPEVDGVDIYEALLDRDPDLAQRLVFCSGGAFTARTKEFIEQVSNIVVSKPVDFELVRRLVFQMAERRSNKGSDG